VVVNRISIFFMDLRVFLLPDSEKRVTGFPFFVCRTNMWMCSSIAAGRLIPFHSYSKFNSLYVLGRCLANLNIPGPKMGPLQIDTKI
jgi:hypothetical protein